MNSRLIYLYCSGSLLFIYYILQSLPSQLLKSSERDPFIDYACWIEVDLLLKILQLTINDRNIGYPRQLKDKHRVYRQNIFSSTSQKQNER